MVRYIRMFLLELLRFFLFTFAINNESNDATTPVNSVRTRALQTTVGVVNEFILIDSELDVPLTTITNGQTINIATLKASRFSIKANVIGTVNSIKFGHNSVPQFHVDNAPTIAFCGNSGSNYFTCDVLKVGKHTVTATPYYGKNLRGNAGLPSQVTFTIIDNPCPIPTMDPNWVRIPYNYPIEAIESQGEMLGTNIFITGGFINNFKNVTVQSFARDISVTNNTWRKVDNMPVKVGITHAAVVAIGLKLYMCGGYSGIRPGRHVANCFIYDQSKAPGMGQWSNFPDIPNGGSGGAGMIFDSATRMLYYAGGAKRLTIGSLETTDIATVWKISIDTPSTGWMRSTPFPYKANHLSAVTTKPTTDDERHFFAGGQLGENELNGNVGDMFEFIPSTEKWIRRASLPSNRSHMTLSTRAAGCGFIMAGGTLNSVTTKKLRTAEILYYNVPTNKWITIGNLPIPGATHPVFLDDDNNIYFISGRRTSMSRIVFP